MFQEGDFIEIYLKCDLQVCEERDPKGLYRKARKGEISNFTGISSPYEAPRSPEIVLETSQQDVSASVQEIIHYLQAYQYLREV